jgi:hypothetical protein
MSQLLALSISVIVSPNSPVPEEPSALSFLSNALTNPNPGVAFGSDRCFGEVIDHAPCPCRVSQIGGRVEKRCGSGEICGWRLPAIPRLNSSEPIISRGKRSIVAALSSEENIGYGWRN